MNDARDEGGEFTSFEEEIYWRYIKRISFCTTFRSDSLQKLQIPKKFADKIRSNLLNPKMTLEGPSGAKWEVGLIRVGEVLFIQDGWQEFANAFSLQENDILIFKYDRSSTFSVKIFSGECEKIAAYFVKKCGHVAPADVNQKKRVLSKTDEDVENDVRNDEVFTATKKSRNKDGTELVNHVGKVRCCVTIPKKILSTRKRVQLAINLVRKKAASRSIMGKQGRVSHARTEPDEQHEQNNLSNDEVPIQSGFEDIASPANRAETETDELRKQNSLSNYQVPIQSGFENIALPAQRAKTEPTKQHERNSFNKNKVLHQCGLEKYSLVPILAETGPAKQQKHNSLMSLSNNEVPRQSGFVNTVLPATRGDIELAKQPEKYISIKRELAEPGTENVASPRTRGRQTTSISGPADIECISNRRPVTDEEKNNAKRKAALEQSENSFLVALPMSSCYKYFTLTIPSRFAAAHLGLKSQEVSLCMGNKKWITKFSFSMGGLCSGWKKFALNNNLEESDVCLFKLVDQKSDEPVMLDVTIFRVVDEVTPPTLSIVK